MNFDPLQLFYAVYVVAVVWLGLLWAAAKKKGRALSVLQRLGVGLVAAGSLLIMVDGLPLWSAVFSLYPNPSLLLVGMVTVALWKRLTGISLFRPEEWRAGWLFGAVGGCTLYLHSMVHGPYDLYFFGWDRETVIACTAGLGVVFLVNGNRFGILFIAALLAFGADILESANGWDYLIDPAYWLIGTTITTIHGFSWLIRQVRSRWRARDALALKVTALV